MSTDRGFVKFYRSFWDNQFLRSPEPFSKREAWLYLFSNLANGIDRNGVGRGEFIASIRFLAKTWRWSKTKVERFMSDLQKEGMIERASNPCAARVGHLSGHLAGQFCGHFIICNYNTYQESRDTKRDTKRDTFRDKSNECIKEGKSNPSLFDLKNDQKDSGLLSDQPQEKPKRKKPATASPDVFEITDSMVAWAKSHSPTLDIKSQTEAFLDFHRAKGNVFRDWEAAWRTWMRNAQKWGMKPAHRDIHAINQETLNRFVERGGK